MSIQVPAKQIIFRNSSSKSEPTNNQPTLTFINKILSYYISGMYWILVKKYFSYTIIFCQSVNMICNAGTYNKVHQPPKNSCVGSTTSKNAFYGRNSNLNLFKFFIQSTYYIQKIHFLGCRLFSERGSTIFRFMYRLFVGF